MPARRGWPTGSRFMASCSRARPRISSPRSKNTAYPRVSSVCARHSLHPLELPGALAALAPGAEDGDDLGRTDGKQGAFGGFCADTFRFLDELGRDNRREWMDAQRERYRFAVREPMTELCRALAERYVGPVLGEEVAPTPGFERVGDHEQLAREQDEPHVGVVDRPAGRGEMPARQRRRAETEHRRADAQNAPRRLRPQNRQDA